MRHDNLSPPVLYGASSQVRVGRHMRVACGFEGGDKFVDWMKAARDKTYPGTGENDCHSEPWGGGSRRCGRPPRKIIGHGPLSIVCGKHKLNGPAAPSVPYRGL